MTTGLKPGELIIVAGRPSMGKTTFALNAAMNAAVTDKKKVAIFSLEMSAQNLVRNMLCALARFPGQRLRRGGQFLSPDDLRRLADAAGAALRRPDLDRRHRLAHAEPAPREDAGALKAQQGLDLIVVDYLQLMEAMGDVQERGQPPAGDLLHQPLAQGPRARARGPRHRHLAAQPRRREARGPPPQLSDLRECVTGDTPVLLADGTRAPVRDLVGTTPDVLAVDDDGRVVAARSDRVWSVGTRAIYRLRLMSGRTLRATGRHRLLTPRGWLPIGALSVFDEVLVATETAAQPRAAPARGGAAARGNPTVAARAARARGTPDRTVHVERIVALEPAGEEEVFDLTVPGPSSWLADGIVSHNSGAIEQDADVICLLYRPFYYTRNESERRGAEVIVAKQRNGPTDTVRLHFFEECLRFDNPAPERM